MSKLQAKLEKLKKNRLIAKLIDRKFLESFYNTFLIILLGFSIAFLLTLYIDQVPISPIIGSVAKTDLKADQNYEIIDQKSTASLREEAASNILTVYNFDTTVDKAIQENLYASFEGARLFLAENTLFENGQKALNPDLESQMKQEFQERLGVTLTDDSYLYFRKSFFDVRYEKYLAETIRKIMQSPLVHSKKDLANSVERGFTVRKLSNSEPITEEIVRDISGFNELLDVRETFLDSSRGELSAPPDGAIPRKVIKSILNPLVAALIRVNLTYNALETDLRRQKARENIKDVIVKIKRGESIIRSGDRFEPWHLTVIEGIRKAKLKVNNSLKFLWVFLFVNLVIFIVYYYSTKYVRKFKPSRKDLIFLGIHIISFLLMLRFGVFLAASIKDALPFTVNLATFYYAIPIAAGAMLVRLVLTSEYALVFAVIISLFSGIFLENNLELTVFYLISGVFASHVVAHVDKRSTVLKVGLYTGLINALVIVSLNIISSVTLAGQLDEIQVFRNALFGILGGISTSFVVLTVMPVVEALFNYTTDIKLLELANMSHPLLKQMIVKAPGTYHHSQIVGILAEAGAQTIDANPLLCRVASYYHDIGKMKKPQYFVENQQGENPHDKLSPSMSALIIEAHVTDGIQMAHESKLPQKIADMIPQHQGTKLIGFFYNKAKNLYGEDKINESDFRYIGPKPQTREAGIIMMADTIEAAVRSLSDKSPDKIRNTVEKLVNQHFVDEQLDDCDLTLKDIHKVAEAFIKILVGIYHQRIEYPEGALLAQPEAIAKKITHEKTHGPLPQQRTSSDANITHLFRKKNN